MFQRVPRLLSSLSAAARRLSSTIATLTAPSGTTLDFPVDFLRENISSAWDAHSLQRVDNKMWHVSQVLTSKSLTETSWELTFDDGVTGTFHLPAQEARKDVEDYPRTLWGGDATESSGPLASTAMLQLLSQRHEQGGLRFSWKELEIENVLDTTTQLQPEQLGEGRANLSPSAALARSALIEATHTYGMAMVDGVPRQPNQGVLFADRVVGAVETTNFGYKFVIKSVNEPHNLAFDSISLQHHTDFTYCKKPPDVALFHCLNNADEGGDSLWVDGFACAEELRRVEPDAFALLTQISVQHMDVTDKWDLQASHATIEVESTGGGGSAGALKRIYFNERTRDSWRAWQKYGSGGSGSGGSRKEAAQFSPEFYDALKKFERIVEKTSLHINTPLQPGELVLFDNARVLHSRTEFVGARHMEGSYLEWGSAYATWRSLQPQITRAKEEYCGNVVGGSGGGTMT